MQPSHKNRTFGAPYFHFLCKRTKKRFATEAKHRRISLNRGRREEKIAHIYRRMRLTSRFINKDMLPVKEEIYLCNRNMHLNDI